MKGSSAVEAPKDLVVLPNIIYKETATFEIKLYNLYLKHLYKQEDLLFKVLFDKKHRPGIY